MNMQQLVAHYGSQRAIAEALGTTEQVVSAWNRNGIPAGRQFQVEIATKGLLKADPPAVRPIRARRA